MGQTLSQRRGTEQSHCEELSASCLLALVSTPKTSKPHPVNWNGASDANLGIINWGLKLRRGHLRPKALKDEIGQKKSGFPGRDGRYS